MDEQEASVVLVEEDADLRDALEWLLACSGFSVHSFAAREAALSAADAIAKANLLLVDLGLEQLAQGTEFIQAARHLQPQLPAALISARLADEPFRAATTLPHLALFPEPFDLVSFDAYLRRISRRRPRDSVRPPR